MNKVFVSGCFDLLHSGHIRFLETAASYGELYVSLGSDENIKSLKGRYPTYSSRERLYMLKAIKHVKGAFVAGGQGILDYVAELKVIRPDFFIVNTDGDHPDKRSLCQEYGIKYVVLDRLPLTGLATRSSTSLKQCCHLPYRLDLAGGWLDQPTVSRLQAGPVVTISLEPIMEYTQYCGMATSTREAARGLWGSHLPYADLSVLAKQLFCADNFPGQQYVSGSQDAIGIVYPGVARSQYSNGYWPVAIDSILDEATLTWLETHICLVPTSPRLPDYDPYQGCNINKLAVMRLAASARDCWDAIIYKDVKMFGNAVSRSFYAQTELFPNMVTGAVKEEMCRYKGLAYGHKVAGAGGGGYVVLICDKVLPNALPVKIRRSNIL